MSIFVDKNTKAICQGITGTQASFHIQRSLEYGTKIVGGTTPGKGGSMHLNLPVFDTVKEAVKETQATASVMYVPPKAVKVAAREAIEAELDVVVSITDRVPLKDMLEIKAMLKGSKTKFIGPNTPGIITPKEARLGIFPENIHKKGNIGVVSRSSTLTYEGVLEVNRADMGQSTVVGLGDDVLIGIDFIDALKAFHDDENTKAIVMIGQLGGGFEEVAADWYKNITNKKPVIAFVAGNAMHFGHKMGYAGDVLTNGYVSVLDKADILSSAGMIVVDNVNDIHLELAKFK
ncbi:MAG: succinate--CoA ligase subunit alpha [Alphaproteobacteria bacterium]|nr:succinate--CoA ligase subunit alpha [Alphaproteobacteria bacterium]